MVGDNMKKSRVLGFDWGHDKEKQIFSDGENYYTLEETTYPKVKLSKGDIVVTENPPTFIKNALLEKKVILYQIHVNKFLKWKQDNDIFEKSDERDALELRNCYLKNPELFRFYEGEDPLKALYATFKEVQKVRISCGQRVWANGGDNINKEIMKDVSVVENNIIKKISKELKKHPIHYVWLSQVKGLGPSISGGLVSAIGDIERFDNPSKLWKYFGLDVQNGKAPRLTKGKHTTYDPTKRAIVLGVLGEQFIKQKTPIYRKIYDNEKQRQLDKRYEPGVLEEKYNGYKTEDVHISLNHAHKRAIRKMIKVFMFHYWFVDRMIHGLDTRKPYPIEKLNHTTYIEPPFMDRVEDYLKQPEKYTPRVKYVPEQKEVDVNDFEL